MSEPSRRTSFAFLMATLVPVVACVCFATLVPCTAQTQVMPVTSAAAVPDGTQVHFEIEKDLKSGGNKAGEDVPFTVSRDVYSTTRVLLITSGTPAVGKILESSRHGMFGKAGKLKYTIDYILMPDHSHLLLRTDPQLVRGRDNRTATIATAILLTPLTLFINGRDVTVKKGTEFAMYVNSASVAASPVLHPEAATLQPPAPMVSAPHAAPPRSLCLPSPTAVRPPAPSWTSTARSTPSIPPKACEGLK